MFQRIFDYFKKSGGTKVLTSADLDALLMGGSSAAGVSVTRQSALGVAAVYACVKILSESLAQIPLNVGRRMPNGVKQYEYGNELYELLHYQPNSIHTSVEFRELMMSLTLLQGDGVGYITRGSKGKPLEILPVLSPQISLKSGWEIVYKVPIDGTYREVPRENIFHIRGLSVNGYSGMSPISYQRETLGQAISIQRHGSALFKNGTRPSGVLIHPQKLSNDSVERIKESWDKNNGGGNQGGTAVLEEGMTYTPISMSNKDAQYIEAKQLTRTDIFSIFRVPPHMAADLTKSSFNNIEQQSLEFLKYSLLPWIKRWEQAARRDLLTEKERREGYFIDFNLSALERADIKTRFESYTRAIQNGIMSPNEARELEGMNPREGGDIYLTPVNMTTKPEAMT